jgi:uncharacterized protein YycO
MLFPREGSSTIFMRLYFYHGKGIWAALIRWFTRSKYAHVSIAFEDGEVYEARPGKGVVKGKLKSTDGVTPFNTLLGERPDAHAMRVFCESELGTPYDYWGCICFLLGIKQRRSERAYFCSEFVADAMMVGGVQLQERVDSFKLSPDNLSWSPILVVDYTRSFQWDHAGRYGA